MKTRLAALLLTVATLGCGSDTIILFRTSFGTITEDATCRDDGGEFRLREQQGLVVVVILTNDSTVVLVNGSAGSCRSLTAGARASVNGAEKAGRVTAREVRILSG